MTYGPVAPEDQPEQPGVSAEEYAKQQEDEAQAQQQAAKEEAQQQGQGQQQEKDRQRQEQERRDREAGHQPPQQPPRKTSGR